MFDLDNRRHRGPAGARGWRAYAVGDIHGRLDLLDQLLEKIAADVRERPTRKVLLIFMGDLIDRGPQSAEVIERLRTYRDARTKTVFLLGNHEEVLLRILGGDAELITKWRWFGGTECLQSYGVDVQELAAATPERALALVRKAIPKEHRHFLEQFVDTCRFGDFLFVHAGIRPGVEIDQQKQSDLRWIRQPFLTDSTDHGFIVVHGHTISPEVELLPNRIGIDTGAYRTGLLSALAIEGSRLWRLDTRPEGSPPPAEG